MIVIKYILKAILLIIVWTIMLLGFILFYNNVAWAATSIDPNGVGQHEYTEILKNATDEDMEMLERVVFNEAGRCDDWRLRLAVVETVLNRVLSDDPYFKDSIAGVCKQKNQFCHKAIKNATEYELEGVSDAILHVVLVGRTVLPATDYVYFAIGKQKQATDHIYLGDSRKWQHMYFGRAK